MVLRPEATEDLSSSDRIFRPSRILVTPRSLDGKIVVITLWRDGLNYEAKPIVYDTFSRPDLHVWVYRLGNRERIENLIWARDHCNGLFRVVITVAEDVKAKTRKIDDCYPKDDWLMQITNLDENTGEFRAVKTEE